jgi:NADPH:quinone reductase-like Zn-dependent oxidoreductase
MKAARIHAYGDADVFQIEEVDDPEVRANDVLVRVHATSVNPIDYKIRAGSQRGAVRLKLPWILGMDVSGVVEAVGDQVTDFAVGDAVFSSPTHRRPGTYAELVAIDASAVAPKPETASHVEAASLPLVGLTAWDCLSSAKLESGETILIQAGAGGVGTVAIQLAKALGATVATTCSARNVDFVRELGADVVIDYNEVDFEDEISDCDVVLESMGGEIHARSVRVLRRGGRLVSINSGLPAATARWGPNLALVAVGFKLLGRKIGGRLGRGVKVSTVMRTPSGANLAKLGAMVDEGAIKPVVAEVFSLDRIADAHRAIETGRTRGKNVISVIEPAD